MGGEDIAVENELNFLKKDLKYRHCSLKIM